MRKIYMDSNRREEEKREKRKGLMKNFVDLNFSRAGRDKRPLRPIFC
jgi:hypothetical protein